MAIIPKWGKQRKQMHIKVDESRIKISPLGNEMSVEFTLCDKDYYVIISPSVWDRENSTIPAQQVGEVGDMVLVSFPATSLGTYTLRIPKSCEELEKYVVASPGDGIQLSAHTPKNTTAERCKMSIIPTWYEPRKQMHIKVDESRIKISPLGNEMSVKFTFSGKDYYVIIPTFMWDKANSTIPAQQVGEIDDMVLVSFPATSLGTYTLRIPKSCPELSKYVVASPGDSIQ